MNDEMTQEERLEFLTEEFYGEYLRDNKHEKSRMTSGAGNTDIPADIEGRRRLLRSLMNIRMPKYMPENVMRVQDEYLKKRVEEKGIVALSDIPEIRDGLSIWQGDITRLSVDAIVNAANSQMLGCFIPMHTCIDNPMLN